MVSIMVILLSFNKEIISSSDFVDKHTPKNNKVNIDNPPHQPIKSDNNTHIIHHLKSPHPYQYR